MLEKLRTEPLDEVYQDDYLQLKSLSSITDEHAIEVAKLNGWAESDLTPLDNLIKIGQNDITNMSVDWHLSLFAYQYIQQQGYALPIYFKAYTIQ